MTNNALHISGCQPQECSYKNKCFASALQFRRMERKDPKQSRSMWQKIYVGPGYESQSIRHICTWVLVPALLSCPIGSSQLWYIAESLFLKGSYADARSRRHPRQAALQVSLQPLLVDAHLQFLDFPFLLFNETVFVSKLFLLLLIFPDHLQGEVEIGGSTHLLLEVFLEEQQNFRVIAKEVLLQNSRDVFHFLVKDTVLGRETAKDGDGGRDLLCVRSN